MRTLVAAGGRRLALYRTGTGGPAVVFLPGAGLVGLDYLQVATSPDLPNATTSPETNSAGTSPETGGVGTSRVGTSGVVRARSPHPAAPWSGSAVLYDRAGTGWSDPIDLPRGATELRTLLHAAGVPGPYVLVGHSMGAFYARRFAQLFPGEVGGLLLIDPGHEDMFDYLPEEAAALNQRMKPDPAQLPDLTAEQLTAARAAYARLFSAWPEDVRAELVDHHLTHWRTALHETANLETDVHAEMRGGDPLPDVPMIVLSATGRNPYWAAFADEDLIQRAMDGIRTLHASIAASVPRGEHRLIDGSHQFPHIEQPDTIRTAIRDLINTANLATTTIAEPTR